MGGRAGCSGWHLARDGWKETIDAASSSCIMAAVNSPPTCSQSSPHACRVQRLREWSRNPLEGRYAGDAGADSAATSEWGGEGGAATVARATVRRWTAADQAQTTHRLQVPEQPDHSGSYGLHTRVVR